MSSAPAEYIILANSRHLPKVDEVVYGGSGAQKPLLQPAYGAISVSRRTADIRAIRLITAWATSAYRQVAGSADRALTRRAGSSSPYHRR